MLFFKVIHSDEERFEYFFNKYYKYACRVCLNIVHNPEVVEDIITWSFFKGYDRLSKMTSDRDAKVWISAIVRNDSKNHLKSISSKPEFNTESYETILSNKIDLNNDILDNMLVSEAVEEIYKEIMNMSKKMADTLLLFYKFEMRVQEISEILNVPEKTIYGRIKKGTDRLKKTLLKKGGVNHYE